jgi:hypothetical protein
VLVDVVVVVAAVVVLAVGVVVLAVPVVVAAVADVVLVGALGSHACGNVKVSADAVDELVLVVGDVVVAADVVVVGKALVVVDGVVVVVVGTVWAFAAPAARANMLTAQRAERNERDMYR